MLDLPADLLHRGAELLRRAGDRGDVGAGLFGGARHRGGLGRGLLRRGRQLSGGRLHLGGGGGDHVDDAADGLLEAVGELVHHGLLLLSLGGLGGFLCGTQALGLDAVGTEGLGGLGDVTDLVLALAAIGGDLEIAVGELTQHRIDAADGTGDADLADQQREGDAGDHGEADDDVHELRAGRGGVLDALGEHIGAADHEIGHLGHEAAGLQRLLAAGERHVLQPLLLLGRHGRLELGGIGEGLLAERHERLEGLFRLAQGLLDLGGRRGADDVQALAAVSISRAASAVSVRISSGCGLAAMTNSARLMARTCWLTRAEATARRAAAEASCPSSATFDRAMTPIMPTATRATLRIATMARILGVMRNEPSDSMTRGSVEVCGFPNVSLY